MNRVHAQTSTAGTDQTLDQIRSSIQYGILGGLAISAASMLIMVLYLVQALFLIEGWSPRLALLGEGLLWSSLVGAAGVLVLVASQALRCLFDQTYRSGPPLAEQQ
jgi:hypothetical protein